MTHSMLFRIPHFACEVVNPIQQSVLRQCYKDLHLYTLFFKPSIQHSRFLYPTIANTYKHIYICIVGDERTPPPPPVGITWKTSIRATTNVLRQDHSILTSIICLLHCVRWWESTREAANISGRHIVPCSSFDILRFKFLFNNNDVYSYTDLMGYLYAYCLLLPLRLVYLISFT
jgi:hypothetical protein